MTGFGPDDQNENDQEEDDEDGHDQDHNADDRDSRPKRKPKALTALNDHSTYLLMRTRRVLLCE